MKDQYFGDVNDFRKYALLRSLVTPDRLRLGVCWMLTETDNRSHGRHLSYLRKRKEFRDSDPILFDWLKLVCDVDGGTKVDRRTARIERSPLLGSASFHTGILSDRTSERKEYFTRCSARFAGYDLVFFDPDNGLEVMSTPRGRKNSSKYLFWDEACDTFSLGSSVLIYQHFIREKKETFIPRMSAELRENIPAATIFHFETPHVLFLLASQPQHASGFRKRLAHCKSGWAIMDIRAGKDSLALLCPD